MNNKFQRILASILAMIMVIIPVSSMAEEIMVESDIKLMSLLPIEEVNAYIDLTEFPLEKLPLMTAYELFSHLRNDNTNELIDIDVADASVWANFVDDRGEYQNDTWEVIGLNESINILEYFAADNNTDVEVIIGSGNQLDPQNVRYFVDFRLPTQSANMDLRGHIYNELYNFDVTKLVERIPRFKINDVESLEILWYVGELLEYGYEFEADIINGWLKADYKDSVKFAPTLEEMYMYYGWSERLRMIIKHDNTTSMYTINAKYPEYLDMFEYSIYTQDNLGKRKEVEIDGTYGYAERCSTDEGDMYCYTMCNEVKSYYPSQDVYYLGINLSKEFAQYDLKVIKGWEYDKDEIRSWIIDGNVPEHLDITKEIVAEDMSVKDAGMKEYWLQIYGMEVMLCVKGYNDIYVIPANIGVSHNYDSVDVEGLFADVDGERNSIVWRASYDHEKEEKGDMWYYTDIITYHLEEGYKCDDEYSIGMIFYDGDSKTANASKVDKAVVGHYYSLEEVKNKPDIKEQLFPNDIYAVGTGYKANFSGSGVDFTVFASDEVWHFRVRTEEEVYNDEPGNNEAPEVGSDDSYFRVLDLYNGNDCLDTYIVPYKYDTYYSYGYQTLLINDTEADMSAVSPEVNLGYQAKVYYGDTMENTNSSYYNKLSPRDFTGTPADAARDPYSSVRYTVSAQDHTYQKNYWVTAVKKEEGAKLFVNGPDEREIFLNNYFGNVHDIFIANVGSEELTGITATIDAKNIKLDDYWTVGGDGNNTLAPFTTTSNNTGNVHGELFNVARIRLIPDGEGEIEGTLTITADGQEPRVITLTGTAGNPKIDTAAIHDAVKYVPYSSIITTNNMHDWNIVTFSVSDGRLPDGLTLYPSGEIYGVPKETGEFPITIKAKYSHGEFETSYANLVLTVKDNSDANINASVDDGYEITTRLPATITRYADMEFVIDGEFAEFVDLWLDGEKLVVNVDYTARSGSTKITIKSQTFSNAGTGKHTISAEFRVGGDKNNELKTSSQNFTIGNASPTRGGGSLGGNSSYVVTFDTNGGSAVDNQTIKRGYTISDFPSPVKKGYIFSGWFMDEALTQPFNFSNKITSKVDLYAGWNVAIPNKPSVGESEFSDVTIGDWFYEDVRWAYTNDVMVGYSDEQFAPSETTTSNMVVTVLAKLANADVTAYENMHIEGVEDGKWYTPYANWAKDVGIADGISFASDAEITREMMCVVLVKFFEYMEKEFVATEELVDFADADLISENAMESVETLYKLGIFKGKGDNTMDPLGNTTRAEFAALIHRVYTYLYN